MVTKDDLIAMFDSMTPETKELGEYWYQKQRQEILGIARNSGRSFLRLCAACSALSPQTPWKRNLEGLRKLADGERFGVTLYQKNAEKAWGILNRTLELKTAFKPDTKTWAFFNNLAGNENVITIDTWMIKALAIGREKGLTPSQYREASQVVIDAANDLGLVPAQFQAMIWVHTRGKAD